jgi:hypothetical protein
MNDKDKYSNQNQRAKKNSLDEAILGGFKSSAKRFAEYRQNSNVTEDWKGSTVAAAPDEQGGKAHSRREWMERLFQLFDQYSQDFNKLVDEPHLISACYPPQEQANENPLINRSQGLVSTKHWQLLVRLQKEGLAGFLLPKSMEQTFLKEESLFERIFLIEAAEEYQDVWGYDGKPTDYSQLPTLARRFFGSLIEIARNEEDLEEETDQEDAYPSPINAATGNGIDEGAAAFSGEQAVFKDLLNFGQNQGATPGQEWQEQEPGQESGLSNLLKDNDETGRIDLVALERSRANGEGAASINGESVSSFNSAAPFNDESVSAFNSESAAPFNDQSVSSFNSESASPLNNDSAPVEVEKNAYWSKSSGRNRGTIEFSAYREDGETVTEQTESSTLSKETEANTEELEMLKTEELTIASACEMMRHSIDKELEAITRSGMRAFENQDLAAIEKAMKRTKKVKEFKEQLSPVLSMWDRLDHEED